MIVIQACQGNDENLVQADSHSQQSEEKNQVQNVQSDFYHLSAFAPKAADMLIAFASVKGTNYIIVCYLYDSSVCVCALHTYADIETQVLILTKFSSPMGVIEVS